MVDFFCGLTRVIIPPQEEVAVAPVVAEFHPAAHGGNSSGGSGGLIGGFPGIGSGGGSGGGRGICKNNIILGS